MEESNPPRMVVFESEPEYKLAAWAKFEMVYNPKLFESLYLPFMGTSEYKELKEPERPKAWKSECCGDLMYYSGDTHRGGTYLARCIKCNEACDHIE